MQKALYVLVYLFAATLFSGEAKPVQPNILFIFADDLGYGDVNCYNPESKIPTPNLDKLASQGMRFTDAHAPATVCTPSRYSLLTGQMAFRIGQSGVFCGVGGPCLIDKDRLTLPQMLRDKGYETALFGKWHVGMTFYDKDGNRVKKGGVEGVKMTDFSRPIPDAPIHRGFDRFFGTACCPTTDWLYAFVDGDRVPVPPTRQLNRKLKDEMKLPDHPYSKDCREGMIAPDFDMEEIDFIFLKKSLDFLDNHMKTSPDRPFFLLHCTQAVHLPSFAGKDFKGKTKAGPHGDFISQFDHLVGELMKALEKHGLAENTIVMVSSDNGPELPTVKAMRRDHDHDGARPWRGLKRDNWDGGHRVPFIARWPGKVKPGSTSDQTCSLTDIMATCAEIVGTKLPNDAAEDSISVLPALMNPDLDKPIRKYTLQQAIRGAKSIRWGKWKYLDHKGSGGNNYERTGPWGAKEFIIEEKAPKAPGQLYDLEKDPGETENLYFKHPEIVEKLKSQLKAFVESGRSVPTR